MFNNVYNSVKSAFSLENSSKIGDLNLFLKKPSVTQTAAVLAAPVFNSVPLPHTPANMQNVGTSVQQPKVSKSTLKKRRREAVKAQNSAPAAAQRTHLLLTAPNKISNFNRFAARILCQDAGGAAKCMLHFINEPQRDVLMQRAASFLARLQQPFIPAPVRAALFAASKLISGDQLTNPVKRLKIEIPSIRDLKGSEIFEYKCLRKRVKQGDAIAAFKLFQVCWTDRFDIDHVKALYFLGLAKVLGCKAADAAFSIIYKSARSDLLEARIVRIIITNMDPYASGFRLGGTPKTIQFGALFTDSSAPHVKKTPLNLLLLLDQAHDLDPDACYKLYNYFFYKMKNTLIQGNPELEKIVNQYGLPLGLKNSKDISWHFLKKAAQLGNLHAQTCIIDFSKTKSKKVYM